MRYNSGKIKREYPYPQNLFFILMSYNNEEYKDISFNSVGLEKALQTLTKKQQQVIYLYYREGWTLEQIAQQFGVTYQYIRQIRKKAERNLRRLSNRKMYIDQK